MPPLLACLECDALQRPVALPAGAAARCCRCGAHLYRGQSERSLERGAALLAGALILLAVAHLFPILGLEMQGQRTDARILDSVVLIHEHGMPLVAGLLLLFTLVMPLLHVGGLLAVLLPLLRRRRYAYLRRALGWARLAGPWSMVEVMILGVLVSLVKLASLATILPGVALGAFAGFIVLNAAALGSLDGRDLWRRLEASP